MQAKPSLEKYLLDAYMKTATPKDVFRLISESQDSDSGEEMLGEIHWVWRKFSENHTEEYVNEFIELLMASGEDDENYLSIAFTIIQNTPVPPAATGRVINFLLAIDNDRQFSHNAQQFFWYEGPIEEFDPDWPKLVRERYGNSQAISDVVDRFARISPDQMP